MGASHSYGTASSKPGTSYVVAQQATSSSAQEVSALLDFKHKVTAEWALSMHVLFVVHQPATEKSKVIKFSSGLLI